MKFILDDGSPASNEFAYSKCDITICRICLWHVSFVRYFLILK